MKKRPHLCSTTWRPLASGLAIGVALAVATGSWGVGLGVGLALGAAFMGRRGQCNCGA